MANIVKIDHGQSNWDEPLNQMLGEIGKSLEDTGLIKLPLKNTVPIDEGSYLTVRSVGSFLGITAQFACASVGSTTIGDIPSSMIGNQGWKYLVGYLNDTQAVQFKIDDKFHLLAIVPSNGANHMIVLNTVISVNS